MNRPGSKFIYQRIAAVIEHQIINHILQTGDKLPSLRTICRQYGVSQNTALKAYYLLESKLMIESRPQSGYYVRRTANHFPTAAGFADQDAAPDSDYPDCHILVRKVYDTLGEDNCLLLSLGTPAPELLPVAKLNKGLIRATHELKDSGITYDRVEGSEKLRRQIARWSFAMECNFSHEDIIISSGCLNALSYCMMALTAKGDTVVMESPVSFGMLQLAQSLGLKVLELPTDPQTGIDLNALESALQRERISLCLLISNFSNPLGSCMPDTHKMAVVQLLEKHQIPLIENDINGDIYFGPHRPKSCKTFDKSGLVLWCGSVSKSLAPGYRVGWVAAGRFRDKILRMKSYHSISTTSITQEVIARFLETGRYEHHLRKLRHTLHANLQNYHKIIAAYFPPGTTVSRPQGGFVLWVALPQGINTTKLYDKAKAKKISFAPGRIFTLQNQYTNCLRLNYGLLWNDRLESSLKQLGELARAALKHKI